MRTRWILSILCVTACQGHDRQAPSHERSPAEIVAARHARVEQLSNSCDPRDLATLILISSGSYEWSDGLEEAPGTGSAEAADTLGVRCHAMREAMAFTGLDAPHLNRSFQQRMGTAIDQPGVRQALTALFGQDGNICGADFYPPSFVAHAVMRVAPIESLLPLLEARDRHAADEIKNTHVGTRAARIDAWAAELTAEGFQRALATLDPSFQWNDGLPPPAPEEASEIRQHGLDAGRWLAARTTYGVAYPARRFKHRVCEKTLQDAIQEGELGAGVLDMFQLRDADVRELAVNILDHCPRPSSRERLMRLAESVSDAEVRHDAFVLLRALDRFEGKTPVVVHEAN